MGSFRDPDSRIILVDGRVLRVFSARGATEYDAFDQDGLRTVLEQRGQIVQSRPAAEADVRAIGANGVSAVRVVEHPRLPFISYPYEWSFAMLKAAAQLQLDLLRGALARDFTLKDATPYNVQFLGGRPIFIDVGSFERWRPGEPWRGYAQFCRMFLNPLMLEAYARLGFQPWLRGALEGIEPATLSRVLPLRHKLRRSVILHVLLQAWLNRRFAHNSSASAAATSRGVEKRTLLELVDDLARIVDGLRAPVTRSPWVEYAGQNTYDDASRQQKERFVAEVLDEVHPVTTWDLGCNTGEYSAIAAQRCEWVVAMDSDAASVDTAYLRLRDQFPNVTTLVMDLLNPSPDQGWGQAERMGLERRGPANLALCLALVHHLRISGNVPFARFFAWLARVTRAAVVEFVPKTDPMVVRLLHWRRDVFDDYERATFEAALGAHFRVIRTYELQNGRTLYHLDGLDRG